MQIASLVLAVVSLVISMTGVIFAIVIHQKKNKKVITPLDEKEVEGTFMSDLLDYCKEKELENVYYNSDEEGFLCLCQQDENGKKKILQVMFPTEEVGSSHYLEVLESQKEQIDEYIERGNK